MSKESILLMLEGKTREHLAKLIEKGAIVAIADDGIYVYDNKHRLLIRITPQYCIKRKHFLK